MRHGFRDEINRIAILSILAVISGFLTGYYYFSFIIAGLLYTGWLLFQTRRFYIWLEKDDDTYPPDSGGIWGDIFDEIYRNRQRNLATRHILEARLDQIQGFTSALKDGVVLIDSEGNITWWNEPAQELLGLKPDFDTGKPILNIIRHPKFVKYFRKHKENETLVLTSPQNPAKLLQYQIAVFGRDERLLMVQDVTRMRRLEEMRTDFVANVSHELRTPLTIIIGFLEPMMEDASSVNQKWQKPLQKIFGQVNRMAAIVTDLTILSRLDNQDYDEEFTDINVGQLLEKIREDALLLLSDDEQQKTEINIEAEAEQSLYASYNDLYCIFSNLVFNAVKYTNNDNTAIEMRYWIDSEGVHVSIADNGIGIDPVHLPRLTERFYRVDSSRSRSTGGTGLGLAIVKHGLQRYDGDLTIASELGKGSTFTCHFDKQTMVAKSETADAE